MSFFGISIGISAEKISLSAHLYYSKQRLGRVLAPEGERNDQAEHTYRRHNSKNARNTAGARLPALQLSDHEPRCRSRGTNLLLRPLRACVGYDAVERPRLEVGRVTSCAPPLLRSVAE